MDPEAGAAASSGSVAPIGVVASRIVEVGTKPRSVASRTKEVVEVALPAVRARCRWLGQSQRQVWMSV